MTPVTRSPRRTCDGSRKTHRVQVERVVGGERAHADGDADADGGEHAGHHQRREEARHDQVVDRLDAVHAQRVDLLGDDHRADLGGDAGADARGQHHRRQRRAELVHQDLDELGADLRQVAGDAVDLQAGLEHQHHAEEAERDADEQQRAVADLVQLRAATSPAASTDEPRRPRERAMPQRAGERVLPMTSTEPMHRRALIAAPCVMRLSEIMMATAAATTASLTARPTPTAPPLTLVPKWQLVIEMAQAEDDGLDEADRQIPRLQVVGERVQERRQLDVEQQLAEERAAGDGDDVADERSGRRARSSWRRTRGTMRKRDRIDGERAQAVELLGDGHGAELGGVVGADAAGEHEADEDRARPRAASRSRRPSRAGRRRRSGVTKMPDWITMMPPVKKAVSDDDGQRLRRPSCSRLRMSSRPSSSKVTSATSDAPGEQRHAAGLVEERERGGAERSRCERSATRHSGPSSSPRTNWRTTGVVAVGDRRGGAVVAQPAVVEHADARREARAARRRRTRSTTTVAPVASRSARKQVVDLRRGDRIEAGGRLVVDARPAGAR